MAFFLKRTFRGTDLGKEFEMPRSKFAFLTSAFAFAAANLGIAAAVAVPASSAVIAPERGPGSQSTSVSGVYQVTLNLTVASTLPANSTVVCKAAIAPALRGNASFSPAALPLETAASVAQITGGTATCMVEIPFSWTLSGTSSGAALSFEVDAVNSGGALPAVLRSSVQQGIQEPYPAQGGTSNLIFNLTF